jgi:hypothetical protein
MNAYSFLQCLQYPGRSDFDLPSIRQLPYLLGQRLAGQNKIYQMERQRRRIFRIDSSDCNPLFLRILWVSVKSLVAVGIFTL